MRLYLHSAAVLRRDAIAQLDNHPEYRRATIGMKLATAAAEQVLAFLPADQDRSRIALSVGTDLGELSATYTFLHGIATEGVARPLAFQNSLHHSTLGFISRTLQITGPGLTVSHNTKSGDDALWVAQNLLEQQCDFAIVIEVEEYVEALHEPLRHQISVPENQATALLVSLKPCGPTSVLVAELMAEPKQSEEREFPLLAERFLRRGR